MFRHVREVLGVEAIEKCDALLGDSRMVRGHEPVADGLRGSHDERASSDDEQFQHSLQPEERPVEQVGRCRTRRPRVAKVADQRPTSHPTGDQAHQVGRVRRTRGIKNVDPLSAHDPDGKPRGRQQPADRSVRRGAEFEHQAAPKHLRPRGFRGAGLLAQAMLVGPTAEPRAQAEKRILQAQSRCENRRPHASLVDGALEREGR